MNRRIFFSSVAIVALLGTWGWTQLQGKSGQSMTQAANEWLTKLSDDQRKIAQLDYETPTRVDWHFIPKDQRKGLQVKEMNEAQRKAAHALLKAALSEIGYDKSVKIMSLELILKELEKSKK